MAKKRIVIYIPAAIVVLLAVGIGIFATRQSVDTPDRLLSLGEKYLTELNYEQALVQFIKVIEIDPMNPRGYTGAAEAYIGLGQTDDAIAILRQGLERLPDNTDILRILDELTVPITAPESTLTDSTEVPSEAPAANEVVDWSVDDWVFGEMSVFNGSVEALADVLNGELRYEDDYFGLGSVTIIATNITENGYSHGGVYINSSGQFGQIVTSNPGISAIRGITIGKTTLDEALEMFLMPDEPVQRNERGVGVATVKSGDGGYNWFYHTYESRSNYDGNTEKPDQLLFYAEVNGLFCNYSIHFTNGLAEFVWFENIGLMDQMGN